MNIEKVLAEIEGCRERMHRIVDEKFDMAVQGIITGKGMPDEAVALSAPPSHFKGTKPAAVIFPDGRRVGAATWRKAVTAILQDCMDTPVSGGRLMAIRGKVMGRQRVILGASPEGMDAPLEIGQDLFMEGKFDTGSLLYVLTKRVLEPAGYDYGRISIQLRRRT